MFGSIKYSLLLFLFVSCSRHYYVTESSARHYDLKEIKKDSLTMVQIMPYKTKLDADMEKVIAISDSALTRDGSEPTVGNFVLQSLEYFVNENYPELKNKCVLIINRGGLRNNLPAGEITIRNIFELMPFDNEIVILTISGNKMKDCIEAISTSGKILPFNISFSKNSGKTENVFVLEKELSTNENYTIITTDYLAGGGDNCSFFITPISYNATRIKLRDALISYCYYLTTNKKTIKPYLHGKIRISK